VGTGNSKNGEINNNVEFSLQSLKQALESEKSASELVDKFSDTVKLQEDLGNERFARKRLEEDVVLLKKELRECESKVVGHLELLTQNQLISADLDVSQQQVADLLVQNESFQKEIDILDRQLELDAENIRESEQKKYSKEINKYKSLLAEKDRIIAQQQQEKAHLQHDKRNFVEDTVLFHWMTVAIRLDYTMHNEIGSTSFDKNAIYEKLKNENVPYSAWPKRILEEIVGLVSGGNGVGGNGVGGNGVGGNGEVVRKTRLSSKSENMPKKPDLKSSLKISKQ